MDLTIKYFAASWCASCQQQGPIMKELDDELSTVTVEKVDVDENQEEAASYNVRSVPTIIIESDEQVEESFIGLTQKNELVSAIESIK